jgi:predicted O-methyltransferase YrrM
MLLYALIAKYKPKNILEFGTASGYATLCMAWAMEDHNIDGKIFTIDIEPMNKSTIRATNCGNGYTNELISRKEIWNKIK